MRSIRCDKVMTMSKHYVGPVVNFQGQARAAMEFYQTVLGGTLATRREPVG